MEHNWFIRPSEGRRRRQENELGLTSAFNYGCQGVCVALLRKANQTISHSSEERRRPESSPFQRWNINRDRNQTLLCVDEAAAASPLSGWPGGERRRKERCAPGLQVPSLPFSDCWDITEFFLQATDPRGALLLERRGSETASLACRPFDEVVETTFDQRLGQIALLGSSRLSAGSHGSHRARVEQWSTRVVLHLNHEWTSVFCSWLKATVSSSIVQDKMSCWCLNFHRCYWVMYVFMLLFFICLFGL